MADASHTCATAAAADLDRQALRVAGCDLGKATAKFVVGTLAADGQFALESRDKSVHEGKPLEAFCNWYQRRDIARCAALGATGLYAKELAAPEGWFQLCAAKCRGLTLGHPRHFLYSPPTLG